MLVAEVHPGFRSLHYLSLMVIILVGNSANHAELNRQFDLFKALVYIDSTAKFEMLSFTSVKRVLIQCYKSTTKVYVLRITLLEKFKAVLYINSTLKIEITLIHAKLGLSYHLI